LGGFRRREPGRGGAKFCQHLLGGLAVPRFARGTGAASIMR
jgi:hypothetical protein